VEQISEGFMSLCVGFDFAAYDIGGAGKVVDRFEEVSCKSLDCKGLCGGQFSFTLILEVFEIL
jgi:hypothetical protein